METYIQYVDYSKVGSQSLIIEHEDLLPCPFCGKEEPHAGYRYRIYENGGLDFDGYVECRNHGCKGKISGVEINDEESRKIKEPFEAKLVRNAVKKWNDRVK